MASDEEGADGATDWRKLREFTAVDLTRSYVLSWEVQSGILMVDVDLHLQPEHAFYEEPRPAQKVCIRPAVIEFPYCESVLADTVPGIDEPAAVAGALGLGAIKGFRRLGDGRNELRGTFGVVVIDAERPLVRLKEP